MLLLNLNYMHGWTQEHLLINREMYIRDDSSLLFTSGYIMRIAHSGTLLFASVLLSAGIYFYLDVFEKYISIKVIVVYHSSYTVMEPVGIITEESLLSDC